MAFIDTLSKLTKSLFHFNTGATKTQGGQSGLQRAVSLGMEEFDKLSLRRNRQDIIKDVNQMVSTDARVDRLLYKLTSDASLGGVDIKVESGESESLIQKAQEIIDRTIKNISLKGNCKGWSKGLLRDGDLFLQLIVDSKEREIVRAKQLAANITFHRITPEGNYPEDKKAFYQEDYTTGQIIREFERWEIVHLKWDSEDTKPYGKSIFNSARLAWKRLDSGEKDLAIRRKLRAGQKLFHQLGNKDNVREWTEVEEYKERNKDTIDNPQNPIQDFYGNGLVDISIIKGDETIGDLDDLKHHEGLLNIATGVPTALMSGGRETDINRDVLEEQEEDYYRVIGDVNEAMENALIQIINFAFLLKGINPESITYSFNWGIKDRTDRESKLKLAQGYQELGLSFQTIFNTLDIDELTFEDEIERIENQIADNLIPYGINTKLDPTLATVLSLIQNQTPEILNNILELKNGESDINEESKSLSQSVLSGNGNRGRSGIEKVHSLLRGNGN